MCRIRARFAKYRTILLYKTHVLDNPDIDLEDTEAILEDPDPPDPTR